MKRRIVVSVEAIAEIDAGIFWIVSELEDLAGELGAGPEYERVVALVGEVKRLRERIDQARLGQEIRIRG